MEGIIFGFFCFETLPNYFVIVVSCVVSKVHCEIGLWIYNLLKKSSRLVRHERLFLNPCCESLMISFFSTCSTVLSHIMDLLNRMESGITILFFGSLCNL